MAEKNISSRILNASKWSVITELTAKLISPVLNMILARILAPEAFGILATVTMVITFAEVFVESGFQKYLVQHKFDSKTQEQQYMSVAFWANLLFAFVIWGIVAVFNRQIADLVGSPGKGYLLCITGVTIPLYGIVGIQTSKLKKDLNFKKLFYVRIASALVPLVITVPLALLGLDYWALIIGNIAGVTVNVLVLTVVRAFRPSRYFAMKPLKEMLGVGIWTMLNGVAVWLTSWFDAFLIGRFLSEYYLGLYKNSVNIITAVFTMITAAITPVLYSSLSKLQDDEPMFKTVFYNVERVLCLGLLPLGTGLLLYQDFATEVLLGSGWSEAAAIIGITSFTTALRTIFVSINGDVFRSKGYFKVPLIVQVADFLITLPVCYFALQKGFWTFVYVRSIMKLFLVIPEGILMRRLCGISFFTIVKNAKAYILATCVMAIVALGLQQLRTGFWWNVISVVLCMAVYFSILLCFASERKELVGLLKKKSAKS